MADVDHLGVRIHYEVSGDGPALVLHHGFTDSLVTWAELGYVEALAAHRRVITIDARGHGDSDKPHDPNAYTWETRAHDVLAVLDAEHVSTADFYGVSMGGSVGVALASRAPGRFRSLMIGAASGPDLPRSGWVELLSGGAEAILAVWETQGPIAPGLRRRVLAVDVEAMLALASRPVDGEENLTAAFCAASMPRMLIAGELDPGFDDIVAVAESDPRIRFVPLPGLNHYDSFRRTDLCLPHLLDFLEHVDSR